jgi:hypothetical protein
MIACRVDARLYQQPEAAQAAAADAGPADLAQETATLRLADLAIRERARAIS